MDEYQDTNRIQADLIDILNGPKGNLMVVGDDAQSIYSWRGANFENILRFGERYPGALTFKIETNYRSAPEILTLANAAIAGNVCQFPKELRPARKPAQMLPGVVPLHDPSTQANFVAQRILELRDEGIELDEMAILYRAHYQSMEIQMELTSRGIPFEITSGLRFFEQAHIKDIAAFVRFAVNRRDEISFKRMARLLPGIGEVAAGKLWRAWMAVDRDLDGALPPSFSEHLLGFPVPKRSKGSWEQLAYTLDELIELDREDGFARPSAMVCSIMEGVYDEFMRGKFQNYDARRQDIEQLSRYSEKFASVEEFLSQLALLSGVDDGPSRQEPDPESVTLSSIHQAKGLEWQVVFVVWLCEGSFPSGRALEDGDDEALEEERRLFYVAVTRAKDELYLAHPQTWYGAHSGDVIQRPSRFLGEVPEELVEEWRVGGGSW